MQRHGVAERTVRNYCVQGKIAGAQLVGKTWSVPAELPPSAQECKKQDISPFEDIVRAKKTPESKAEYITALKLT